MRGVGFEPTRITPGVLKTPALTKLCYPRSRMIETETSKPFIKTMKIKTLIISTFLILLVAFMLYRHVQKSHMDILNEWTGRSLSTRTKSDEAILPPGWKKGAYVNNV